MAFSGSPFDTEGGGGGSCLKKKRKENKTKKLHTPLRPTAAKNKSIHPKIPKFSENSVLKKKKRKILLYTQLTRKKKLQKFK